ncbi:MAG: hypothetical protein AAGK97_12480, partial [Bacteroidota bacterium]
MLFFLSSIDQLHAQSYIFSSQAEVDGFPSVCNCNSITGNLIIRGTNISNLDSIQGLSSIGNSLIIENSSIINIVDFSNLESIGGSFRVRNNPVLENIDGFSNLEFVGNSFQIDNNFNLQSITGLANLDSINSGLLLRNNPSLENIDGFSNLLFVNDNLHLSNSKLASIDVFSNLEFVGNNFQIENNAVLQSIIDLSNLNSVVNLLIRNNSSLTECCAFYELINNLNGKNVSGSINILRNATGCDSFDAINNTDTDGDSSIDCIDDCPLAVDGIPNFDTTTCDCVAGFTQDTVSMNGQTVIVACIPIDYVLSSQAEVDAFPSVCNCTSILGNLTVSGSDITNLDSLGSLISVGGNLEIISNSSLTNLNGLSSLDSVGNLSIVNMGGLVNIDGLSSLSTITNNLSIVFTDVLENFNGLSNLTSIGG